MMLEITKRFIFVVILFYLVTCEKLPDTTIFNPIHSGIKVDTIEVRQIDAFSARIKIQYSSFAESGKVDSILLQKKDTVSSDFKTVNCFKDLDSDSVVWTDTSIVLGSYEYQAFGMLKGKKSLISGVVGRFTFPLTVDTYINKSDGIIRFNFEFGQLDESQIDSIMIIRTNSEKDTILRSDTTFYEDSCLVAKIDNEYKYVNIRTNEKYRYSFQAFQKRLNEKRFSDECTLDTSLNIQNSIKYAKALSYDSSRIYFDYDEDIGESNILRIDFLTRKDEGDLWQRADSLRGTELARHETASSIKNIRDKYYFHLRPKLSERRTLYQVKLRFWIRDDYFVEVEDTAKLFPLPGFRLIEVDPDINFTMGDDSLPFANPKISVRLLEDYWIMETEYFDGMSERISSIDTTSFDVDLYSINDLPCSCSFDSLESIITVFSNELKSYLNGYNSYDFDLPTEAEWEYAASVYFPEGKYNDPYRYNWGYEMEWARCNYGNSAPTPVKSFPSGKNALYDMNGNMAEWVQGFFNPDFYKELNDNTNPVERDSVYSDFRIIRGGSFKSINEEDIRNQARFYIYRGDSIYDDIGFRLVIVDKSNRFGG